MKHTLCRTFRIMLAPAAVFVLSAPCGCARRAPSANPEPSSAAPAAEESMKQAPIPEAAPEPPPQSQAADEQEREAPGATKDDADLAKKREGAGESKAADTRAYAPAPAAPPAKAKRASGAGATSLDALVSELGGEQSAFERSLGGTQLSCSGASQHHRAICDIADQICDIAANSPGLSAAKSRCEEGRQQCKLAGDKYRARCE